MSLRLELLGEILGIGLKRKCAERFGVYEIDEYGTSKYCSHCGKEVKNFYYKRRKVHRVLICKECSGPQDVSKVRFMHRDINGSKNIRELGRCELSNLPRPVPFCRKKRLQCTVPGAGTEKKELNLVKKVPKIIKKIKAVGRKAELTKEMV